MNKKYIGIALVACVGLGGCASTGPGTANANGPNQAPSGVTSSNGGGQRQLGSIPSVGIGNGMTTTGPVPNSKGASY
jgi:hypothetical protein